jgi:protein-tyrosine phosphatase
MEPKLSEPTRILFVCLGNIVRSPLAENIFRHLANEAGVGENYDVDSAGTAAYHIGDSPDSRMRQVAAARGLDYDGSGRQVSAQDFYDFDLIIPMDTSNSADLMALASKPEHREKIHMMREFDSLSEDDPSVPDPYYGGIDGFEQVYDIVERSARELLARLQRDELKSP